MDYRYINFKKEYLFVYVSKIETIVLIIKEYIKNDICIEISTTRPSNFSRNQE